MKRHNLTQNVDVSDAWSIENMQAHIGEPRTVEYIGSRKIEVTFDYYRDAKGKVWFKSHKEECHV